MILFFTAFSQQKVFNTKTYELKGTVWYELDKNTNQKFRVDTSVVTVKFKSDHNEEDFKRTNAELRINHYNKLGYGLIRKPQNIDLFEFVNELKKDSNVVNVEINTFGHLLDNYTPNDPYISDQWYLNVIDVPGAWNYTRGSNCTRVIVAVIGTGIQFPHEDFGYGSDSYSNIYENPGEDSWPLPEDPSTGNGIDDDQDGYIDDWKGWNFYSNNNNPGGTINLNCDYLPPNGHGTNVAGIIGAKLNNSVGVAGIAGGSNKSGVKLLSIVVVAQNSECKFELPNAILPDAIIYAVDRGAKIINMSIVTSETSAIDDAIDYAVAHGVALVASAGNTNPNGGPLDYPASNSSVISVGATDMTAHRADFSDYGSNLFIAAPGVNMYSTVPDNGYGWYQTGFGTSLSAPVVSGVIALMLSVNPSLTLPQIKNILSSTADEAGGYTYTNGKSLELGYGQVNANKAVEAAIGGAIEISGPTNVCTSDVFNLTNLPSGSVATWTANPSGNVSLNYNGNGEQVTVTKLNAGQVTLSASISYLCDNIKISSGPINVGTLKDLPYKINYYNPGMGAPLCTNYPISFELLTNDGISLYDHGVTDVQWVAVPGSATINYNAGDYYHHGSAYVNGSAVEITFHGYQGMSDPSLVQVKVNVENACGWTGIEGDPASYILPENGNVQITDCGLGYLFSVAPNPAQNSIVIANKKNLSSSSENRKLAGTLSHVKIYVKKIRIYDASGKVVLQQQFSKNMPHTLIDISSLTDGIYFVEITDTKDHKETHKLIIGK